MQANERYDARIGLLSLAVLFGLFVGPVRADEEGEEPKDEESADDEEWIRKWQPFVLVDTAFNATWGDEERFQEYTQRKNRFEGGLRHFSLRRLEADADLQLFGRLYYEDEFRIGGRFEKFGLGFIQAEFEQYPRYTDSSDVEYSWRNFQFQSDDVPGEPQLDLGRFSFTAGMRVKELPKFTFTYERLTDDGTANLPFGGEWVPNLNNLYGDPDVPPGNLPNNLFHAYVYPLERRLDLVEDRLALRAEHSIGPVDLSARAEWRHKRGEEAWDENRYIKIAPDLVQNPQPTVTSFWEYFPDHLMWTIGANARIDAIEDVLRFEFDYGYTRVESDSQMEVEALRPNGTRDFPAGDGNHSLTLLPGTHADNAGRIHRFLGRIEFSPADPLSAWFEATYTNSNTGAESTRLEDGTEGVAGGGNILLPDEIWEHDTTVTEKTWREELGVRYTGLPRTTLTLIGAAEQSDVNYDWHADFLDGPDAGVVPDQGNWYWDADADHERYYGTLRAAVRATSWATLHPYYRYDETDMEVKENERYYERKVGDPEYTINNNDRYYPGQIKDLRRITHTTGLAVVLEPSAWARFKPRIEYRRQNEINDEEIFDNKLGRYRSTELGLTIDLFPTENLTFSLDGTVRWSKTRTPSNKYSATYLLTATGTPVGTPNTGWRGGVVDAYRSDYWSIRAAVQYDFERWTLGGDLSHTVMDGNWETRVISGQVGVAYRFTDHWRASLGYQFLDYDERGNDDYNDFGSHTAMLGLEFR